MLTDQLEQLCPGIYSTISLCYDLRLANFLVTFLDAHVLCMGPAHHFWWLNIHPPHP